MVSFHLFPPDALSFFFGDNEHNPMIVVFVLLALYMTQSYDLVAWSL